MKQSQRRSLPHRSTMRRMQWQVSPFQGGVKMLPPRPRWGGAICLSALIANAELLGPYRDWFNFKSNLALVCQVRIGYFSCLCGKIPGRYNRRENRFISAAFPGISVPGSRGAEQNVSFLRQQKLQLQLLYLVAAGRQTELSWNQSWAISSDVHTGPLWAISVIQAQPETLHSLLLCFHFTFFDKYPNQKQLWEERVSLTYISSSQTMIARKSKQELKALAYL